MHTLSSHGIVDLSWIMRQRWCSLFNADLALSVTMTAISTIVSVFTLPLNLIVYANLAYEEDVTSKLDWKSIFMALVVVISAIVLGIYFSAHNKSLRFRLIANKVRRCLLYCDVGDLSWMYLNMARNLTPLD